MAESRPTALAKPEAIPSLTPLRGVAALLVVAFHLHFYIPNLRYEVVFPAFHFGYLWVDFFFILSGFIIAHVYGRQLEAGSGRFHYASFLYVRWCRIYPLHFAVLAAFVAFEILTIGAYIGLGLNPGYRAFSNSHTVPGIFTHLLLINSLNVHDKLLWNFPAWSISAEAVAYVAFPVLFASFRRLSPVLSWLAFALLLLLLNLLALSNGGRLAIHHDFGAVRCLLEFSIGILVYRAYRSGRCSALLRSDAAFSLVAAAILLGMWTYARDILIVLAFAALVLLGAGNAGRVARILACRPFVYLGEISYSVYMVNILIFQVAHAAWYLIFREAFGHEFSRGEAWVVWFAAMGVVIAVASCTYHWIERPARTYLRARDPFAKRAERLGDAAHEIEPVGSLAR